MKSRVLEAMRGGAVDPFVIALYHGGGKGAPPAPDYTGAANAQSAASKEIATQQNFANRPNITTPFGSQTWDASAGTDPSTGLPVTNWSSNLTLTPDQQQSLDAQQRITSGRSQAAETLLGQATGAFQTPFNWDTLPQAAGTPQARNLQATTSTTNEPAFAGERQRIEDTLFNKMRPEFDRQEAATRTRLGNMGLSPGSEGYNRELERLQSVQAGERFNAFQTAGQEQQRIQQMLLSQQQQAFGQEQAAGGQNFGQEMSSAEFQNKSRQQAIAEEAQRRGMPLSELNALLTGQQVNMPNMPQFQRAAAPESPQLLQAAIAQGNYGQAANQGPDVGAMIGGVASVAAPLIAM